MPVFVEELLGGLLLFPLGEDMNVRLVLVGEHEHPVFAEVDLDAVDERSFLVQAVFAHLAHDSPFHFPGAGDPGLEKGAAGDSLQYAGKGNAGCYQELDGLGDGEHAVESGLEFRKGEFTVHRCSQDDFGG